MNASEARQAYYISDLSNLRDTQGYPGVSREDSAAKAVKRFPYQKVDTDRETTMCEL